MSFLTVRGCSIAADSVTAQELPTQEFGSLFWNR